MEKKNTQSVFFGCEQSKNVYVIKSTFVPLISMIHWDYSDKFHNHEKANGTNTSSKYK